MNYQTDDSFIEEIQEYGCLFLSLAYYKTKTEGYEWSYKELNALWTQAKNAGYINAKCEIVDYVNILRLFNIDLIYTNKHEPVKDIDEDRYFAITKWFNKNTYHFVVGSKKPVEYDPYSAKGSKTVREGIPIDMRLFEKV